MKSRRRRKGFDEERKRELRKDLERYFTLSKNLSVSDNDFSNGSLNIQDGQLLDPQSQLEKSQQFGHNFGDVSVFPEQTHEQETESDITPDPEQEASSEKEQEIEKDNETVFSKLALEQIQDQEEARKEELYNQQAQYLVDLPSALESVNQGHIIKSFHEPFLVLEELLVMSERENPALNALQRLWLVWGKWETYYTAWNEITRDDQRQLPGKGRDDWNNSYQERGIHELEITHLENTILRVMQRDIIRKSTEEREYMDVPTPHQLHGYFIGLRRQDWDATSWQLPTPNGAITTPQLDDDYWDHQNHDDGDEDDDND